MSEDGKEYKIVVLGSGGVGKSALTIRLVTDNFLDEYDPTIEDSYRKQVSIDGSTALLDILDTAGQEEFSSMQDQWMREGKGFLLVYSITSSASWDEISTLRDKILRAKEGANVPIVVVGNKCDLADQRKVDGDGSTDAKAPCNVCKEWKSPWMETSAKGKIRNEDCFYEVVRQCRKFEKKASASKGSKKGRSMCALL